MFNFIIGLALGLLTIEVIYRIRVIKMIRAEHRRYVPSKIDKSKLCKGPHSWIQTEIATKTGSLEVQLCRLCGFISGTEMMASQEAIERIEENKDLRELETRLFKDFMDLEDGDMKSYFAQEIQDGLEFEKLTHIHAAGMTFAKRFVVYKASKSPDVEKEIFKSNS